MQCYQMAVQCIYLYMHLSMFIIDKQQCNTYIYILIDFIHNQSPRSRTRNSPHIPGSREVTLETVMKRDLPCIYPTGSHTLGSLTSHHLHWELSGLLSGLVDRLQGGPYWKIKVKSRRSGWPLNTNMLLLRDSSGKRHRMVLLCHPEEDRTQTPATFPHASPPAEGWSTLSPSFKALIKSHLSPWPLPSYWPVPNSNFRSTDLRVKPLFVAL